MEIDVKHAIAMQHAIASAREEAQVIRGLLDGQLSLSDVDVEIVGVTATTVVYRRGDKTFHLVVHDMTEHP